MKTIRNIINGGRYELVKGNAIIIIPPKCLPWQAYLYHLNGRWNTAHLRRRVKHFF
jgi:hypothetical protein